MRYECGFIESKKYKNNVHVFKKSFVESVCFK